MLQQTQVATGLPYYERWMERFPTLESLASATEEDVLSAWQGLGYYRRARLLRTGAQYVNEHGWPTSAAEWLKVPSVGPYTAGALASITLGEAAAVVDGNVERVYARVCGDPAIGPQLHRAAWEWAKKIVDHRRPGDWNQSLMELGARVCKPAKPLCRECPVKEHCIAYQLDKTDLLPTRKVKPKPIEIVQHVWVPICNGRYGLRQIAPGKWWESMYEFPREDTEVALDELLPGAWREALGSVRHTVTNHRITLLASLVRLDHELPGLIWADRDELVKLPVPAPQRRILKMVDSKLI